MKIKFLSFVIMLGCSMTITAFAQDDKVEFTQEYIDYINNLPSTEMIELTLNKEDYQLGEVIKGTFKIRNERNYSIPVLNNTVTLTKTDGDYHNAISAFDVYEVDNISLGSLETKEVNFLYTLPKHISGENFGLRVAILNETGTMLSWGDVNVNIIGVGSEEYVVENAYMQAEDKKLSLQEGPIVKNDRPAYVHVDVINPYSNDKDVLLVSSIYEKNVGGEVIKKYENKFTLKPGLNKDLSFMIQSDGDAPGIYNGILTVEDAEDTPTSQLTTFHYIVDGSMVNMHSVEYEGVDINNFILKKDADLSVILNYSGETVDIIDNTNSQDMYLDTKINLTDETGVKIANWNNQINYNKGFSETIALTSAIDASTMNVNIEVIDADGNVIESYKDSIVNDSQNINEGKQITSTKNKISWLVIVFIIMAPFIAMAIWFIRKGSFLVLLLILLPAFSILSVSDAEARNATLLSGYGQFGLTPTLTINTPLSKMCVGDEFDITGSHKRWSCSNADLKSNVTAVGYGGWSSGWHNYGNQWVTSSFTISNGKFNVPSEPGIYTITFKAQDWQRSWDPGDAGVTHWSISYEAEDCPPRCMSTVPAEGIICSGSEDNLTENFEWRRATDDECSNDNKCEYYFPAGECAPYDNIDISAGKPDQSQLCTTGTPTVATETYTLRGEILSQMSHPPTATEKQALQDTYPPPPHLIEGWWVWSCTDVSSAECRMPNEAPGVCNSEFNGAVLDAEPGESDLCASGTPTNFQEVTDMGPWTWDCLKIGENPSHNDEVCSAKCFDFTAQVNPNPFPWPTNGDPATVDVSVNASGMCAAEFTCETPDGEGSFSATTGSTQITNITQGQDSIEIPVECTRSLNNSCTSPPCNHDSCVSPPCDNKDTVYINGYCTEKSCNAQETCQAMPKSGAKTAKDCSSTCNSNADCTSGRMIETKP